MDSHDHAVVREQDIDNSSLIRAMQVCRDAYSPRHREKAYQELLQSTLLVPAQPRADTANGDRTGDSGGEDVGLLMTNNPETGEPVILAFTDRETMTAYQVPEGCCLCIPAAQLFQRLSPATAPSLIVCALDAYLPVSHPEILQLAGGQIPPPQVTAIPASMPNSGPIAFKALDTDLPSSLRQELNTLLAPAAEIRAVYIFLIREDDQQAPGFAAAVIVSQMPKEHTIRPLLDELARCITPYLPVETPLTMLSFKEHDDFASHLGQVLLPYYYRGEGTGSRLN
ncbi:MAG TPA: enhanced serine sensitivity protein SseB C-terminal domain-containing protein [Armatimonadota bacterium]